MNRDNKRWTYGALLSIAIIIAAFFRFSGLDWDSGHHLHPDERQIIMVADGIGLNDLNPHFFAYGSFPIYLLKATGWIVGRFTGPAFASYEKIYVVGRALSALFDIGTLCCVFFILKQLTKKKEIVFLGTIWYALSVLPIQLSHFYAVDTLLTFFMTLTIYLLMRYMHHPTQWYAIGIGSIVGLAATTKVSALVIAVPVLVGFAFQPRNEWKRTLSHLIFLGFIASLVFITVEPFALVDFISFKKQLLDQQAMTRDAFTFPYTLQYVGKIPYWYELKNMILWGQGPFLGIFSLIAAGIAGFEAVKRKQKAIGILLVFFIVYFLTVGRFAIGFMRYMLPVYPVLTVFAALLMEKCVHEYPKKKSRWLFGLSTGIILVWACSFMAIYAKPNTRIAATDWIIQNIPEHTVIAVEHWDDALPLDVASNYDSRELTLYDPDTEEKWDKLNRVLQETSYIIIASNRLYVPLMKLVDCKKLPNNHCYKTTAKYYQRLFDGTLGFTRVATFSDFPTVPFTSITVHDTGADESFTVYDHPTVMIFKKTGFVPPIALEE